MISFVWTDYDYYYWDYLHRLHCVCLVVNPNTLGGKPKVYGGTNLGGKPRLSYIIHPSKVQLFLYLHINHNSIKGLQSKQRSYKSGKLFHTTYKINREVVMAVWAWGDKALEKSCSSQVWGRMGGMDFQAR